MFHDPPPTYGPVGYDWKRPPLFWLKCAVVCQRRVKLGVCSTLSSPSTKFSGKHLTPARFPWLCLLLLTLCRSRGGITGTKITVSTAGFQHLTARFQTGRSHGLTFSIHALIKDLYRRTTGIRWIVTGLKSVLRDRLEKVVLTKLCRGCL